MATTKLTLSADQDTIRLAKSIASEDNISVSKLFKILIDDLAKKKKKTDPLLEKIRSTEIPDWINQIKLADKPTSDFDHKAAYGKHLEEKYGL